MGIYVPGITKPDHCCDCQFCEDSTSDCLLQNDAHWSTYSEQIKNCPLIEIPEPHGDLIDRDALRIAELDTLIMIRYKLAYAPTVIEAEGE